MTNAVDSIMAGKTTQCARIFVTGWLAVTLLYTVVFNGLAGPGAGPFTQSTGNVSDVLYTCITPAGFTFSIWSIIYICLFLIVFYAITLIFRKIDGAPAWKAGGAISFPFMLMLIVNLNLNIGWLFAWDAINVTGSFILLLLIAVTNATAAVLSGYSFASVAPTLLQISKTDFWVGILSINGFTFYVMWTILASLINLTAFGMYRMELQGNTVCTGVLGFLLAALLIWFVIENSLLKTFANPAITHYLVVLWAMIGIYVEQTDHASKEVVALVISIMVIVCVLLLERVIILIYRNRNNKIYSTESA